MSVDVLIGILMDEYHRLLEEVGKRRSKVWQFAAAYDCVVTRALEACASVGVSVTDLQDTGVIAKIEGTTPLSWTTFSGTLTLFVRAGEDGVVSVAASTYVKQVTDYRTHEKLLEKFFEVLASSL